MFFIRTCLLLGIAFSVLSPGATPSVWIIGEKSLSFYSPSLGLQSFPNLDAQTSLVDEKTCALWVQSQGRLFQLQPGISIQKEITTPENLLGSKTKENLFLTFSDKFWTVRDTDGNGVRSFPALANHPVNFEGDSSIGFWSLDFNQEKNNLDLIHFNLDGQRFWSKPVSKNVELWSQPRLNLIPSSDQLWISFTVSSTSHAYSPYVELWNSAGEMKKTFPFPDRGLLLDACTTANESFLISRDIPSSPYTVPLFSFLELLSPSTAPKSIYQAFDNYLISSLQCQPDVIWTLQKSVLGGQTTRLVELSPKMEEKNVLPLKEPAWKIHACSLQ
ncbi:MAG: hypothetical protein EBQ92_09660 [Proteobacteria bacterium]|nr:hypothetical protein [Pseudomonadota bacterium]